MVTHIYYRAIHYDETRYPEPDSFIPSRWLTEGGTLNENLADPTEAFGFSRRVCPGQYFARDMLCLAIANILAAFSINKPVDDEGQVIEPSEDFTGNFLQYVVL